jgi:molybdopterin converting factor small subunit
MSEIKIKIKALGQLSKIIDSPEFIISPDDCKLRSVLLKILNYDDPSQIETTLNSILVSINGIEMSVLNGLDTELNNEDNIVIIPIMHGG